MLFAIMYAEKKRFFSTELKASTYFIVAELLCIGIFTLGNKLVII